jgi:lipoprotein-releasing system ATP-binding protein
MTDAPLLRAQGLLRNYGSLPVLRGVDICLNPGEVVSLVGASGAGKTTLLQILGTLDAPDGGTLSFEGQSLLGLGPNALAQFRNRHLGFVFQFHHLLPELTALENVCLPAWLAQSSKSQARDRAQALLHELGLADRLHHLPSQLSGGEQQRVAVARALVNRPKLILADEPTGNLDSQNSEKLFERFQALARREGVALLLATHNDTIAQAADRCLRMQDGQLLD